MAASNTDELQETLDTMYENGQLNGEQYKNYSIKVQNGETLSLDDLATIASQRQSTTAPAVTPTPTGITPNNNGGIPLMSQQQWNNTYGGGRIPPYATYDEYVQATIQQSQETGQRIVLDTSGITNPATITANNIPNPMNPGTMDNYDVGAGVALAQVNGDEYYYGYGAADDPHAGDNSTTYIPGTTTTVSTHAISPSDNTDVADSAAAPSVQTTADPLNSNTASQPADTPTIENNPDAAAWIKNKKQQYIVENGGDWLTEQAREDGIAEAERQAVREYNEKYGTEIQGNAQGAKVTTKTYDADGNVTGKTVRVSNAQGDTTTTYDGQGKVVSKSTTTTTTSKDENGKTVYETTTKTTDGNGRVTSTAIKTTNPDGSSKTVESSGNSTVTTEQASDKSTTETVVRGGAQGAIVETTTRDADGNVTSRTERVSNAQGDTTTTYDGDGNVVSKSTTTTTTSKDENGKTVYKTTTKTTDGSGRVTSTSTTTTNPDGSKKTVESSGNQTTTTEQASDGTTTKTTVRGSAQGAVVTTETYDGEGNLTSRTVRDSSAYGDTSVSVSQGEDGLKVGFSSDREGKTNSEVDIDFEKFIGAYDKVQSLVEAASHISEYKNISGVNSLPVKGGGSIDTSKLTSMACMNGACGRGGNISDVSSTMLKVIKAIVAFDDDSAALWDKYNQEKNGETPEDFGGDLSEDAGSTEPAGSNPGDSGTETATELATEAPTNPYQGPGDGPDVPGPEDVTEATTEMTEEEKMELLAEQLGVDLDELANGAKYITNGEDFDGVNIYYEEGSTTETSLANRMLNILNTFGRAADDQSLYDADGNKIERLDPNATELTFKYKKDGKEHTITLKLNNELPLEDKKYPGIQVIVK